MREKLGAALLCLAFAIPFGGIGAGASWAIVATIQDGMRAKEWVRVKAEVLSHGGGSVLYRYQMDGKSYTGDRLGTNVLGGTDNVDSWHEDMESRLSAARSEGKPITVFVNPDNPQESMADREIRWKLLVFLVPFALAFGGVGVGALYMLGRTFTGGKADAAPAGQTRRQARKVEADQRPGVLMLWVFAFFWNAIAFPIAILFVPQAIEEGEWLGLLVLLFPIIGVLVVWGAVMGTVNYFRHGSATAPQPARPARPAMVGERAMDDEAVPAALGPQYADVERMLGGAGVTLTDSQKRVFSNLSMEQKQAIRKAVEWAPQAKKVALWAIGIFVAVQIASAVIGVVAAIFASQ